MKKSIEPEEKFGRGLGRRPRCGRNEHDLHEHSGKGALALCKNCERWYHCWGHYPTICCLVNRVMPWNLSWNARIRAYRLRGDTDGEAEETT